MTDNFINKRLLLCDTFLALYLIWCTKCKCSRCSGNRSTWKTKGAWHVFALRLLKVSDVLQIVARTTSQRKCSQRWSVNWLTPSYLAWDWPRASHGTGPDLVWRMPSPTSRWHNAVLTRLPILHMASCYYSTRMGLGWRPRLSCIDSHLQLFFALRAALGNLPCTSSCFFILLILFSFVLYS